MCLTNVWRRMYQCDDSLVVFSFFSFFWSILSAVMSTHPTTSYFGFSIKNIKTFQNKNVLQKISREHWDSALARWIGRRADGVGIRGRGLYSGVGHFFKPALIIFIPNLPGKSHNTQANLCSTFNTFNLLIPCRPQAKLFKGLTLAFRILVKSIEVQKSPSSSLACAASERRPFPAPIFLFTLTLSVVCVFLPVN